jgi:uncharacterized cupin superfamily protein
MKQGKFLLKASEIAELPEYETSNPLNPDSELRIRTLADTLGLKRMGVHMVRVAPGKEPNIYHSHRREEEFFYILEGNGTARIGDETFEIGPGDFMAFPTPSVPHSIRNTSDRELVYLVGGERREMEIGEMPELNKLLVRHGREIFMIDRNSVEEFKVSIFKSEE